MFLSVRKNSPELTSRASESATCATTRPLSSRRLCLLPDTLADSSLSTSAAGTCDDRQAGNAPHSRLARTASATIAITTPGSTMPFIAIGLAFGGRNRANVFAVHRVNNNAAAPAQRQES